MRFGIVLLISLFSALVIKRKPVKELQAAAHGFETDLREEIEDVAHAADITDIEQVEERFETDEDAFRKEFIDPKTGKAYNPKTQGNVDAVLNVFEDVDNAFIKIVNDSVRNEDEVMTDIERTELDIAAADKTMKYLIDNIVQY